MPGTATAAVVDSRLCTQHAEGPAAVLAIGTANPANIVYQDGFADYYFGLTKSEYLTELKDKMKRICKQINPSTLIVALIIIISRIEKRYIHLDEKLICEHPEIIDKHMPSLETRVDIVTTEIPKLAESAARKAIAKWGRPATDITHLIFSTYSGLHGCSGGGRALQLAKELAENNREARVPVACAELTLICFSNPDERKIVGHGLFGDGAGAIIVGTGPLVNAERPLFEMIVASQTTIPGYEQALGMQTTVHPGGRAILDNIEGELQLQPAKLAASRHVLSEYGNMSGTTIAFVLDDLRRRREKEGDEHQQPEWGVMLAFGPGITIEAMVLPPFTKLLALLHLSEKWEQGFPFPQGARGAMRPTKPYKIYIFKVSRRVWRPTISTSSRCRSRHCAVIHKRLMRLISSGVDRAIWNSDYWFCELQEYHEFGSGFLQIVSQCGFVYGFSMWPSLNTVAM
uniref:Chalcone synthase n=1 Tax=Oryza sativa subsp. japonica TaxID=39947 RepID=Q6I5C9_ORYSJ|nr:hypothetical protein [Oryza sativa Japonica Group]